MPIVMPEEPSFWDMIRLLREFEGVRCLWRLPVAGFLWSLPYLLPLAAFVVGAYVTRQLGLVVAVGAVTVVLAIAAAKLGQKRPWRSIVSDRLWTYLKPNPLGEVPVLVRKQDLEQVQRVLRRKHLNPGTANITGSVPPDAPDLTCRMGVQEPEQWALSSSDVERVERVASVIEQAGLRARVAGRDVGSGHA